MSPRKWFRAGAVAIISLALSTTISFAQDHGHGHEKHDRDEDDDRGRGHGDAREHEHGRDHDRRYDHDRYSDHDRDSARGWYRTHYTHLPPGLAKRDRLSPGLESQLVVRGILPLGLQRQMRPCPPDLERELPPPPPNYAHVVIGGNLVLLNRANFQIVDVFHFDIH
jgi:Ni/Co efflux regulator RcnB